MATLSTPTGRAADKAPTTKSLSSLIDVDVFAAGGGLFGAMEEVATARKEGLGLPELAKATPVENTGPSKQITNLSEIF